MDCKRPGHAREEKDDKRIGAVIQGMHHLYIGNKTKPTEPQSNTFVGGSDFDSWGYVNAASSAGGIVTIWKSSEVNGMVFHEGNYSVSTEINLLSEKNVEKWLLMNVYGPQDIKSQMNFIQELEELEQSG